MQVKVMMLQSDENNKTLCQCAETILDEVAGAFGHIFSVYYEKIGACSIEAYDAPLTEEAVEACRKCDGVILDDACAEGSEELLDALGVMLAARFYGVPQALCADNEKGFDLWLGLVRSLDDEAVEDAVKQAFRLAMHMDVPVSHVAPNGKMRENWQDAMRTQTLVHPDYVCDAYDAPEAMTQIIEQPSQLGLLLTPPYAGSIYRAAAMSLNTAPWVMRDVALAARTGIYAPAYRQKEWGENVNPIPMTMALADFLRFSASLKREADCVEAAVNNVLEAGWRTPDMMPVSEEQIINAKDMIDLICEQISLAGQLLYQSEEGRA